MEESTLELQVEEYIQFSKKIVEEELVSIILGIIFAILLVIIILRYAPLKYRKKMPVKKVFVPIASLVLVLFGVSIFLKSNTVRIRRIEALSKDMSNWNPIVAFGTVDDRFAFEKGGSAVVIDNETYYIIPKLGLMDVGNSYEYQYLPLSKFIVSYSLQN